MLMFLLFNSLTPRFGLKFIPAKFLHGLNSKRALQDGLNKLIYIHISFC